MARKTAFVCLISERSDCLVNRLIQPELIVVAAARPNANLMSEYRNRFGQNNDVQQESQADSGNAMQSDEPFRPMKATRAVTCPSDRRGVPA